MSSLGDIQQIHSLLQQISKLLDEVDTKTDEVTRKSTKAYDSFKKLEMVALRYLAIAHRLGFPEPIQSATTFVAELITMIQMLHISLTILESSHPYTLPLAIAGVLTTTLTFHDSMAGYIT